MNVIVCIKTIINSSGLFQNTDRTEADYKINPSDRKALELALHLKLQYPDIKITVISMGPEQSYYELQQLYALDVDSVYLLSDAVFAGSDTKATSYVMSQAIKKLGNFSYIFCGKNSLDGGTGQVGARLAECINIPYVSGLERIELYNYGAECYRKTDYYYEKISIGKQAVISVCNANCSLLMPSINSILNSLDKKVHILNSNGLGINKENCGLVGSATKVIGIEQIELNRDTKYLKLNSAEFEAIMNKVIKPYVLGCC